MKMKYTKCTRCELNYCTEEEEFCMVCTKELSGEASDSVDVDGDICPYCDENVLPYGEEMCAKCSIAHETNHEDNPPPVKDKISFIEVG